MLIIKSWPFLTDISFNLFNFKLPDRGMTCIMVHYKTKAAKKRFLILNTACNVIFELLNGKFFISYVLLHGITNAHDAN